MTISAAKNLAEQTSKKSKSDLKAVQTELETVKASLHDKEVELRRLHQINASMQLQVTLGHSAASPAPKGKD
jgi:hypothetical protein